MSGEQNAAENQAPKPAKCKPQPRGFRGLTDADGKPLSPEEQDFFWPCGRR